MKTSLKFNITLAAIAIAASLPTALAGLKGAQPRVKDDINAKNRALKGPPEDKPGKNFDNTCTDDFCADYDYGPGEYFESKGICVSLCKQCGAAFFDDVGPPDAKCYCFAETNLGVYDNIGQCLNEPGLDPEDKPGKNFDNTCTDDFCADYDYGPGEYFESKGICVSLCKQCGATFFDDVGPPDAKCYCFAETNLGVYDNIGQCLNGL